jgi:hypothetical protein
VQPEPDEGLFGKVVAFVPAPRLVEREEAWNTLPIQVGSAIDDHTNSVTHLLW